MIDLKNSLDLLDSYKHNVIYFMNKSWTKKELYNKILKLQNSNINPNELFYKLDTSINAVNNFSDNWDNYWLNHNETNEQGTGILDRK